MKYTLRAVILSVVIILTLSFFVYAVSHDHFSAAVYEPSVIKSAEYILRLENDEIVIYKDGESTGTGIAVSGLRQQDKALLEKGIHVDTYEDVLKLIEDFNS